MRRVLVISFSGGETSAFMTELLLTGGAELVWDEIHVVFANTSQEDEKTLIFVDRCDREIFSPAGYPVVWLEAVQHHGERKAATHRIVSFETACRNGDVFEDMIRKYGIPNSKYPHCTRELKLSPINSYVRRLGRHKTTMAVGIRSDEIDRMSEPAMKRGVVYPLVTWRPTRKLEINAYWKAKPFRLELPSWKGNCKWCWKKSFRKHYALISECDDMYDFPDRMEELYGTVGGEFRKAKNDPSYLLHEGYRRVFFRRSVSTQQLRRDAREALSGNFRFPEDASIEYSAELDAAGGCGESCEVFSDED